MARSRFVNGASAVLTFVLAVCTLWGAACNGGQESAGYGPALHGAIQQLSTASAETIRRYQGDESPEAVNSFWRDFGSNTRAFGRTLAQLTPPKNAEEAHKRLISDSAQLAALAAQLTTPSTGLTLDNTLGSGIRISKQMISDCTMLVQATQVASDCTQLLGGATPPNSPVRSSTP